jgi:uncharacterized surface anchored protein
VESTEGTLVVIATDRDGNRLPGACFALNVNGRTVTRACDADDGEDDGTTTFAAVASGTYALKEKQPPAGYARAKDRTVTVRANHQKKVTARHRPELASRAAANAEDSDTQPGESAAALAPITTLKSRAPAMAIAGPRYAGAVLMGSQGARRKAVRAGSGRTHSSGKN